MVRCQTAITMVVLMAATRTMHAAEIHANHPIVPGFERFYANDPAPSVKGGQLLLTELNCLHCHKAETPQTAGFVPREGPVLDAVGSRVRRDYLRRFLANPQAVKPGTVMPGLFAGLPEKERTGQIEALVHFLASRGTLRQEAWDRKLSAAGKDIYHKVGCVACHGTRDDRGKALQTLPTSVPLGDLAAKYTITSLKRFLLDPLDSHPSGRMPALLNAKEARDVANYLLQDGKTEANDFHVDRALAVKGRALFASVGCANCHQFHEGKTPVVSTLAAPPLAKLRAQEGCLAGAPAMGLPQFALSRAQQSALAIALKTPWPAATPAERVAAAMTAFNCYACHERGKVGGVEPALSAFFQTAQPEMGEEGRVPPPLDGVGAKLKPEYLKKILDQGAHDRPYMLTHMPGFGAANVGFLVDALAMLDKGETAAKVTFAETPSHVKAQARHLVSGQGLGCVKCHTFAGVRAEGVQGIDMTLMTQRLNHNWFRRYVADPQKFRRGTRMPAAWYNGQSPLQQILGGTADRQIEAIWQYLADGTAARRPPGVGPSFIPLVPDKTAIVYRNFIQGAGPRGIAVGYPEKVSLAFDANDLRLAMIWQGAFIDAARHWNNRSEGFEPPLGDNIIRFPSGPSFAFLDKEDTAWPTKSGRGLGYHFRGYRLTPDDRPTFLYTVGTTQVEDFTNPSGDKSVSLRRTLTLTDPLPAGNLWFRAAAGSKIEELGDHRYRINGELTLRLEAAGKPRVRQRLGTAELLVPLLFQFNYARIVEEFVW